MNSLWIAFPPSLLHRFICVPTGFPHQPPPWRFTTNPPARGSIEDGKQIRSILKKYVSMSLCITSKSSPSASLTGLTWVYSCWIEAQEQDRLKFDLKTLTLTSSVQTCVVWSDGGDENSNTSEVVGSFCCCSVFILDTTFSSNVTLTTSKTTSMRMNPSPWSSFTPLHVNHCLSYHAVVF